MMEYAFQEFLPLIQAYPFSLKRPISLISFDNLQTQIGVPLTTVDPGFRALGRSTFYDLTGLGKISKNRAGDIESSPFVVNRGSVWRVNTTR